MAQAVSIVGVVLCAGWLEGLWSWLLLSAIAELDGQAPPSLFGLGSLLFSGWLAARLLNVAGVPLRRRQLLLVGGGLALALASATTHAGLLDPAGFVIGRPEHDYRGSGIALGLLTVYLWGRGLALAGRVNRARITGHIGVSVFMLANILIVLPLTHTVGQFGLPVVVGSFAGAIGALLLLQLAGTESHQWSKLRWAMLGCAGLGALLLVGGAATGVLSSGAVSTFGQGLARTSRVTAPVSDAILLGVGYVAQAVTLFLIWLRQLYGADPQSARRVQEEAEEARRRFEAEGTYGPPEILTIIAIAFALGLVAIWFAHYLSHLVGLRRGPRDTDITERRTALARGRGGLGLRGILDRLRRFGDSEPLAGSGRAAAIRRHYRTFQGLMARADLPRGVSQTAQEYEAGLGRSLPGARGPLATITDAYVLARYAGPDASLPEPESVEAQLGHIRDALRARETIRDPGAR